MYIHIFGYVMHRSINASGSIRSSSPSLGYSSILRQSLCQYLRFVEMATTPETKKPDHKVVLKDMQLKKNRHNLQIHLTTQPWPWWFASYVLCLYICIYMYIIEPTHSSWCRQSTNLMSIIQFLFYSLLDISINQSDQSGQRWPWDCKSSFESCIREEVGVAGMGVG